jgi:hypothetical protein
MKISWMKIWYVCMIWGVPILEGVMVDEKVDDTITKPCFASSIATKFVTKFLCSKWLEIR